MDGSYRANLIGARTAVPRMLDIFEEFGVGVTWATVGFLFANNRQEIHQHSPSQRPAYRLQRLDPYQEVLGEGEQDDPLHYAPSLIREILRRPRQEVATHTFSHYYCLEHGQDVATFRHDLAAASRIASQYGVNLRSIVFPRNQYTPEYTAVLPEFGITSYRGTERHWMYSSSSTAESRKPWRRAARIADNYANLSGANTTPWRDIPSEHGLCNVPSSRFLRAYSRTLGAIEPFRLQRVLTAMEKAARDNELFHLNWHPHNFGVHLEENMRTLRAILERYARLHKTRGMQALSMQEVVETVRGKEIHTCAGEAQ